MISAGDLVEASGGLRSAVLVDAFDNAPSRNLFLDLPKRYSVLHLRFSERLAGSAVWESAYSRMEESRPTARWTYATCVWPARSSMPWRL
jgi:hypothetical protein